MLLGRAVDLDRGIFASFEESSLNSVSTNNQSSIRHAEDTVGLVVNPPKNNQSRIANVQTTLQSFLIAHTFS